jgi:uncharacterized protein (DUF488 family)
MDAEAGATEAGSLVMHTIGHSNQPAEEIIALLRRWAIDLVVDVRTTPYSQYMPQFNREPFARVLQDAGIDYRFAGEYLGGRPSDPTCYKSGTLPSGKAKYLELVDYDEVRTRDWYRKGIARLLDLAATWRAAIMCSEEDPARCHRQHLITPTLLEQGVQVWHIRATGEREVATVEPQAPPEEQQLSLFDLGEPS